METEKKHPGVILSEEKKGNERSNESIQAEHPYPRGKEMNTCESVH